VQSPGILFGRTVVNVATGLVNRLLLDALSIKRRDTDPMHDVDARIMQNELDSTTLKFQN